MKALVNIWILASILCGLFYAWQWHTTLNPQYEPKIAILSGISTLIAFWFKPDKGKARSSIFFGGNRNKISQTNSTKEKENIIGFMGSDNEVNQK